MPTNYEKVFTPHQNEMFKAIVRLVLVEGHTVTLQSFCARTHFKENHHTRRLLEYLVKQNFIVSFEVHFSDGHKRKVYCAQNTRRIFEDSYSSAEIDHHRLMMQSLAEDYQP